MKKSLWFFLLIFPLTPIIIGLGNFIYPRFSNFSDLTISHLPNALFIAETIKNEGFIPLWSDMIMAGYPFAADPLAGLWYPPDWIAILLPAPFGFNLCIALHLLWGGLGMGLFLSHSGLKKPAAMFGGIAFAGMPKIMAHMALGHVSLVYSFAWFPWLIYAESLRQVKTTRHKFRSILPGCILGIIALADIRSFAYAGLLHFLFWLWFETAKSEGKYSVGKLVKMLIAFLGQIGISLGVAAVLLAPLIQFTSLSSRAKLSPSEVLAFSLPIKKLFNLFIPEFGGYAEWIVYPGAVVIFLTILVIATPYLRKQLGFWLVIAIGALLFSLGSQLPFLDWIAQIPGISLLRVPSRLMFVGGIALAVIASYGFNILISDFKKPKFDPIFSMVGISVFFLAIILGSIIMKIGVGSNLLWGTIGLVLTVVVIGLAERKKFSVTVVTFIFPGLLIIDLLGVNFQSIQYRDSKNVFAEGVEIVDALNSDKSIFRIYSPSYSVPQHTAVRGGIEMASVINPLQLENYAEWIYQANGIKNDSYSVSLPPLDDDNLSQSNAAYPLDPGLLGKLNVKYIVAGYPIMDSRLQQISIVNGAYIYKNLSLMPRAWIEQTNSQGETEITEVNDIKLLPGKISIEADGPGELVLSEVDYPGWEVKINTKKTAKFRVANLFMGVELPPGPNEVEFVYKPVLQYTGLGISVIFWLVILYFYAFGWRK